MSKAKRLMPTILCLILSLPAMTATGWTACNQVSYYCDVGDAVRAGSGNVDKSGVYGYNLGHGWGIFGRTTSSASSMQAGVGGENLGGGAGVWGHSATGTGVSGNGSVGVYGYSPEADGVGVLGAGSVGVRGSSINGPGVHGLTSKGAGVFAVSEYGNAGGFQITEAANKSAVIRAETSGTGPGGHFKILNASSFGSALWGVNYGKGRAGFFEIKKADNPAAAVRAVTAGTGWAGSFAATNPAGRGVYIKTEGGQGLTVVGGTKSAAVPTSRGTRALYAEEASEVFFTDYGFGRLENGRIFIPIDPLFAETVNLQLDYFVFLQPYAKAELYVSRTTPEGFEVSLNTGDPGAKFAYRIVAKRKGFETARLEDASRQPESDSALNASEPDSESTNMSVSMNR